ncbi:uncharacterized protein B0H18DRAFT_1058841 [Fomitopsis serialis]|uniref:uncharacterized protein n=1 Tax=Fomitopsis serialis TaxID=139415 RepID=UPI002008A257|nr:uncharacterized protein B0H18DRAFT_1058841 [Neoantrodia serialis]KAH9911803.1 hypothetical protein B0H18DRAFT_1058841 [Neoantrodia serialis]
MADPIDGPGNSPFTRIAALLPTDELGALIHGCTQDLLQTAGPRLESLRVTLAYNHHRKIWKEQLPHELLSSNVNLKYIFIHVTFPGHGGSFELSVGLPQVLSAIGPYPSWQDKLDIQLARLLEEHPELVITLALRFSCEEAVTVQNRPRQWSAQDLDGPGGTHERLEVICAEQHDVVELENLRLVAEPPWYLAHYPLQAVNGPLVIHS